MSKIAQDRDATYNVANLASLFTVCALAIEAADEYADHIQESAMQDIKHVLEWGAVLAQDVCAQVERETASLRDAGSRGAM